MSEEMGWKIRTIAAVLGVIALTVWAAVATGVVKGPVGVAAGAVLTALAGVAAGYVPLIRDAVMRRGAERARLVAKGAADQEALRVAGELPGTGPACLLDPRLGLVKFAGRESELAGLLEWCQAEAARGVRLVTGPGGVGKTRLSVELCVRLDPGQWRCLRVGDREEVSALATARRGWSGPVLLVVDYAETRIGLGDLLWAVAADPGPVRVLLLARSAGEWRDRLAAAEPAVRELLVDASGEEPLAAAVSEDLSNEDLVAAAVPVFAEALGLLAPPHVVVEAGPGATRVLDLHAAALVAVLRSVGGTSPVRVSVGEVLDELLGHEERFWQGAAERRSLLGGPAGMAAGTLRQIVATGALLGAASQDEALELLERVPEAVASVPVARWLQSLYPPGDGDGAEWLGSLRPDRLAERLVVGQLTRWPKLAERCLSGLDERQALRAITLLGSAAADQQEAGMLLERVLPLLEQVVAGLPGDLGLLTAISAAIPYPSAALAEADVAVTRRILQIVPEDDLRLRARWLSWLGVTLAQTGRTAEALPSAQEAVEAYRELAAAFPSRYQAAMAASLGNLSNRFWELGRPIKALSVAQQAVDAYVELVATYPDRFGPDLSIPLSSLRTWVLELRRAVEALPPGQEPMKIRRELVDAYSDGHRANVAAALSNLGVAFSELGRLDEATLLARKAVDAYSEPATTDPDRYGPNLARSLDNLGGRLWQLGRFPEAISSVQEAVGIRRRLVASLPGRYRPDLANSLSNLGSLFSELGRPADALPLVQEALEIRRELTGTHPDRHRPDLARSLVDVSITFLELGRPADALLPAQEAVDSYRMLATAAPNRYRPDLAHSRQRLARILDMLGCRPGVEGI